MNGRSVRTLLGATTAAFVLIGGLAACSPVAPDASASPSATVSETPTSPSTATTSATPTASASTTGSTPGPITGSWKGTWTNESPQTAVGTFTLHWAQQGNQLFGAIGVTGSNCLSAGNVTGSVDGAKISFGAVEGGNMITYTGTVTGTTMAGTYSSACGNSRGTWTAIRVT